MKKILLLALAALAAAPLSVSGANSIDIVPCPSRVEAGEGFFSVKGVAFHVDASFDSKTLQAVSDFAAGLSLTTGRACKVVSGLNSSRGITFKCNPALGREEYKLDISRNGVVAEASSRAGVLYSIQTLKQLLPVAVYGKKPAVEENWKLPVCRIYDKPRFEYRGFMLDCARHIFTLDEVRRFIDVAAIYKMNTFHWHLSDDQGWRVEVKQYPKLTEVGAYRDGTQIALDRKGPHDGIPYGGYYTRDEISQVVEYADRLGITIVPEIDLPGHMQAALASYPELGCGNSKPFPYKVRTSWGISNQVLNVGKETTMQFLENVLGELVDLFPGEYFHIGGDECPKGEWKNDPDCQAKIRELGLVSDENASAETRLQNYVTARIQKFLATKGKKIIGWDEILDGELAEGATVMSWRGTAGGIKASNAGYDVIMSPSTYCYFDYRQLRNFSLQPLAISKKVTPFSKTYSFDPVEGLDEKAAARIKGVQANLWTEYIASPEHLEYMFAPRVFALCEVQWCQPENKNLGRVSASLDNHQLKILDILDFNYCKIRE